MARLTETGAPRYLDLPLVPGELDLPLVPGELAAWWQAAEQDLHADALLEWIEDCDIEARFVPDWTDESFKNAA